MTAYCRYSLWAGRAVWSILQLRFVSWESIMTAYCRYSLWAGRAVWQHNTDTLCELREQYDSILQILFVSWESSVKHTADTFCELREQCDSILQILFVSWESSITAYCRYCLWAQRAVWQHTSVRCFICTVPQLTKLYVFTLTCANFCHFKIQGFSFTSVLVVFVILLSCITKMSSFFIEDWRFRYSVTLSHVCSFQAKHCTCLLCWKYTFTWIPTKQLMQFMSVRDGLWKFGS